MFLVIAIMTAYLILATVWILKKIFMNLCHHSIRINIALKGNNRSYNPFLSFSLLKVQSIEISSLISDEFNFRV